MIDVENEIYDRVADKLREAFNGIGIAGEYVQSPSQFPFVSIIEADNTPLQRTQTSDSGENHAILMYEINVYSNKAKGKKAECKAIAAVADSEMMTMGFTRMMLNPIQNMNDATIYRILGRYRAVVSKTNVIYRR